MKKGKIRKTGRVCLCQLLLLVAVVVSGCGKDFDDLMENHKAQAMREDGVWEERYEQTREDPAVNETQVIVSVDVKKEMSEEDRMEIMDYLKLQHHSCWDEEGNYLGLKEGDFYCYAVFYRGDTDEEIGKIKYVNEESVEITEDDKAYFPTPEMRSERMPGQEG
ncbi:MAG: hypothetical protein SOZ48_05255 [Eubacterium sp.]|nr:hypothetical protein [Eubacterium sp.]